MEIPACWALIVPSRSAVGSSSASRPDKCGPDRLAGPLELFDLGRAVETVTRVGACRRLQQPDGFVVVQRAHGQAVFPGELTDADQRVIVGSSAHGHDPETSRWVRCNLGRGVRGYRRIVELPSPSEEEAEGQRDQDDEA